MRTLLIKLLLIFSFFVVSINLYSQVNLKNHYVKGYFREDGTYVSGHYRTNRNNTNLDNYSTKGNTNPYTGKPGYIEPEINYTSVSKNETKELRNVLEKSLNKYNKEFVKNEANWTVKKDCLIINKIKNKDQYYMYSFVGFQNLHFFVFQTILGIDNLYNAFRFLDIKEIIVVYKGDSNKILIQDVESYTIKEN